MSVSTDGGGRQIVATGQKFDVTDVIELNVEVGIVQPEFEESQRSGIVKDKDDHNYLKTPIAAFKWIT